MWKIWIMNIPWKHLWQLCYCFSFITQKAFNSTFISQFGKKYLTAIPTVTVIIISQLELKNHVRVTLLVAFHRILGLLIFCFHCLPTSVLFFQWSTKLSICVFLSVTFCLHSYSLIISLSCCLKRHWVTLQVCDAFQFIYFHSFSYLYTFSLITSLSWKFVGFMRPHCLTLLLPSSSLIMKRMMNNDIHVILMTVFIFSLFSDCQRLHPLVWCVGWRRWQVPLWACLSKVSAAHV